MNCRNVTDKLVEDARYEVPPGKLLRSHVQSCAACRERLEAEEALTAHLKAIRSAAWDQRSSAESRDMLMARFQSRSFSGRLFPSRDSNGAVPRWSWALAAAAAVVIAVLAAPGIQSHLISNAVIVAPSNASEYQETAELRTDAPADPEAEGFIAVPYVPPLATGEMLRLVHTELNPAALASLGVNVDPAWTAQLPADLLLGEDGMPRAVRVADAASDSGGF